MKSTLKVALLATVLMSTPALASDMSKDSAQENSAKYNNQHVAVDADGKPLVKHHRMHKRGEKYNSQRPVADMDNADRMNKSDSRSYVNARGERVYNDYGHRTSQGRWMGMNLDSRHMTDGADNDINNRGRHAFIFGDNTNRVVKH